MIQNQGRNSNFEKNGLKQIYVGTTAPNLAALWPWENDLISSSVSFFIEAKTQNENSYSKTQNGVSCVFRIQIF